ncbi:MAG: WYL domain-containing protein, partial [Candidatus Pacearchaeota archaeon]
ACNLKKDYPFLEDIEEAISDSRKIILKYEKQGKIKTYKLCPLKLICYEGFWYLLSQVDGKDWILKFRIEHIKDVELLEDYFEEPKNLKAMLDQSTNIWFSERKTKKIVLKIDKEVARFFKQRSYFPYQKIAKENKDGSLMLEVKASDYMEVIPTVLHWIPYITLITPGDMKQEINKLVGSYIKKIS